MPTLAELIAGLRQPRLGTLGALQQRAVLDRPEPAAVPGASALDLAARYGRATQQVGSNYLQSLIDALTAPRRAYEGGWQADETGNITPKFDAPAEANNLAMWLLGANLPVQNPGGMSLGMINAWHGSPHDIPMGRSMKMEKIGTGEGAQAYGHGLYAAENRGTGQSYADALGEKVVTKGQSYNKTQVQDWADYAVSSADDRNHAMRLIEELAAGSKSNSAVPKGFKTWDEFTNAVKAQANTQFKGNLYKLELSHPDPLKEAATPLSPNDFLHWDLPLSQQPEKVKSALSKLGITQASPEEIGYAKQFADEAQSRWFAAQSGGKPQLEINRLKKEYQAAQRDFDVLNKTQSWTGKDAYYEIPRHGAAAAELFNGAGIPGIRYLDGGSRGAGRGTYNYVLFDPKLANIVGKE